MGSRWVLWVVCEEDMERNVGCNAKVHGLLRSGCECELNGDCDSGEFII